MTPSRALASMLSAALAQDIRYAGRRFVRGRGPAIAAVLALGVGVNLAVFSVIHAALIRPLPQPQPDRLMAISSFSVEHGREHLMSPLDFFDIERRARSFQAIAAYFPPGLTITGGDEAERVSGARASSGIINQALARSYFGEGDPIGQRLTLDRAGLVDAEIIGVVGDVREVSLGVPPAPAIYAPKTQAPWMRSETRDLVLRGSADIAVLAPAIHAVMRELEPDMPRPAVMPMQDVIDQALTRPAFYASAVGSFAVAALLLAAFGIFGTVASAVAERRREIGIRLALGASRNDVLVRAAGSGALPTLGGLAAGIPLSFIAGRMVRQQLYGVGPGDWLTLVAVGGLMGIVATAAALLPAIRATRIDPAAILRHDAR